MQNLSEFQMSNLYLSVDYEMPDSSNGIILELKTDFETITLEYQNSYLMVRTRSGQGSAIAGSYLASKCVSFIHCIWGVMTLKKGIREE